MPGPGATAFGFWIQFEPLNAPGVFNVGNGDRLKPIASFQAKYLRGLAHGLKALVFVGQKGVAPAVLEAAREALRAHELIKVKFVDLKDRRVKAELAAEIERSTDSVLVGLIGHTAIFYRPQPDPDKRKITLPKRPETAGA